MYAALLAAALAIAAYVATGTTGKHKQSPPTGSRGNSSRSCTGSEMCVRLPATSTGFDDSFGTQDSYGFTAQETPPAGGPTVDARLQSLDPGAWRVLGDRSYNDEFTSAVSPVNYYWDESGTVDHLTAWDFRSLDKMLSEAPSDTPREVDEEIPLPLFHCASGSWTNPTTGCDPSGHPGALTDQTYGQLAEFYSNLVRYFRTSMLATGAGPAVSYAPDSLTDSSQSFAGDEGDCVTATVIDSDGFPDWVTGVVSSVGGEGEHTLTLTQDWSTAESYDSETGGNALTSATPAAGAAYDLASCRAPGGLDRPEDATPWPRPPSVGDVQYFELFNEPDLSNTNQLVTPPAVDPPSSVHLTGVNAPGGSLTSGTTYSYEIAGDGVQATGVQCQSPTSDDVCGGWSRPSRAQSIKLPTGDNAVKISWSDSRPNDGALPQAYQIYGRTSGSGLGLAVVGRAAASGMTWTDTGAITPAGSPSPVDESAGGNVITPALYYQMWNVVVPAMKAVDPSIKVSGPVEANSSGYGMPSVNTLCVTSDGPNSACTDGGPGYAITSDYIPTLLKYGRPAPDVITFHGYGSACCDTPEASNFASITSYEIDDFKATDQEAVDAAGIPIWIDEANYNANDAPVNSYRSMTQVGSAWLADDLIQWALAEPLVRHIVQWAANSADPSFELFGTKTLAGDQSCVPHPACEKIKQGEPDLEYWTMYELDHLLAGGGKLVTIGNVPAGFVALGVQTDATHVVVVLDNIQQGADDGNGAAGTADVQLQGADVADTRLTRISASTNLEDGPTTASLGPRSHVQIAAEGYEVDLIDFTLSSAS